MFLQSEYLKENFCTTSLDYRQTLQQWDDHKMTDVIQFPVPDDLKAATAPSERSKADPSRWEKNAERLRAMAQMKRDARIQKDQEELSRMEKVVHLFHAERLWPAPAAKTGTASLMSQMLEMVCRRWRR